MKHLLLTTIAAVVLAGCGKPSIHEAAWEGNIAAVKQHLAAGSDVNLKSKFGGTPLLYAVSKGHKEVAELLIAKGADVNAKDEYGYTLLDRAGFSKQTEIADLLRKHGGISGAADSIHIAAAVGNIEAVKQHLAAGTDINAKDQQGRTPLQSAANKGHKEIAELLITKGANVNAKNDRGGTPLLYAASKGHKEVAELLITKGANVNAKLVSGPNQGKTPLDAANETTQTETGDLLRKHGGKTGEDLPNPPNIPLWKAIQSGNIDAVKQHLDAGTDVNWDASSGWTQLTWAAHGNRAEIGKLLIEYGAGVNEHGRTVGHTALHEACRNGHKEFVELLIANDVDVNLKRKFGSTPLAWAENREITELLLANGADVNARNNDGFTPLDSAIQQKKTEIADLLRKHGGKTGEELKAAGNPTEPVAEASQPEPPTTKAPDISIWEAAATGNIEAVKQHLAAGTDVNARHKSGGLTPLHFAVYYGHEEIVELLITKGANVNAKEEKGWTPLHFAAYYGHEEIVELLITKGANVNAKANDGRTPIDWAITQDNTETADLLRKHGAKSGAEDSIHIAARTGNHEAVKQHLAAGADVNVKDEDGYTPLNFAAQQGHKEVVELLIAKGADVNAKDADGKTALWSAVIEGQEAIVVRLVNGGAGVQSRDNKGNTLLHEALPRAFDDGHVKIVELCLAKGLDVNALNNDHSTPLHAAAWRGDGEFAELLLSKGADLNAKNKEGATPLAYAVQDTARNVVRANRTLTAKLLINAGADLDVGSNVKDGKTLLHWAAGKGFTKVIEALVAKGADVNARTESLSRTDQRKTPLHVAAYEGHVESVKVLVANGADVHAVDKGKNTPLLSATGNHREKPGKFEIVKLLVEKGANVNAVENCDRSALYHAASHNELEILEYLISKGADVNVRNRCSSGETPLHAAAKDGDMDVAKLLIASSVDVNAITETRVKRRDKKSPLHFASEKGQGDLAELLIKNGANVKMQDGNGDTVLHFAALKGDKAQMALFLDSGADVNAKNAEGMTPLHKAGRGGVRNTMEAGGILLQGGANINEVVQSGKYVGRTILDFVEKMNASSGEDYRKSVVRYFRKHGGKTGAELEAGN